MDDVQPLTADAITGRGTTLDPFVIVRDATGFLEFAVDALGAEEVAEARTPTPDGRLIHAELRFGEALVLVSDPQDGWAEHLGLLRLWVSDAAAAVDRAVARGATLVTPPTPFYGALTLARIADPWGNLWWLYQPAPGQADPAPVWEGGSDVVFRTLDEHLRAR